MTPLAFLILPALAVTATPGAAAPAELVSVLEAMAAVCSTAEPDAVHGCGAKLDVDLLVDGKPQATFLVLRLNRRGADGSGIDRLWIQAFRNGSLMDYGLDGFGSAPPDGIEQAPYHVTQFVDTGRGPQSAPQSREDHYLGPLRVGEDGISIATKVLYRAGRPEDLEGGRAMYRFFLSAIAAALAGEAELQYLEPGKAYCWNDDGSPTSCDG